MLIIKRIMGLTGEELDKVFGKGFTPVKSISGYSMELNRPSNPNIDSTADVCEQQHTVSIEFESTTGKLTIKRNSVGEGLWIPYLGNGIHGRDRDKGLGTYSKVVTNSTWVASGPFTGCFAACFQGAGVRFAHLITPALNHPAPTINAQVAAIKFATGAVHHTKWKVFGAGDGVVFFMKIRGFWYRRFVWFIGLNLSQINAQSMPV